MRALLFCLLVFALLLIAPIETGSIATAFDGAELIGEYAPNFELFDYKRDLHRLYDLKGSVCVVAFWQPYDENCERALATLESIHNSYVESGVKVIAIDIRGVTTDVLVFLAKRDLNFVFLDGILNDALNGWKIEGVPSVFVIDKEMRITDYIPGVDDDYKDKISNALDLALKK